MRHKKVHTKKKGGAAAKPALPTGPNNPAKRVAQFSSAGRSNTIFTKSSSNASSFRAQIQAFDSTTPSASTQAAKPGAGQTEQHGNTRNFNKSRPLDRAAGKAKGPHASQPEKRPEPSKAPTGHRNGIPVTARKAPTEAPTEATRAPRPAQGRDQGSAGNTGHQARPTGGKPTDGKDKGGGKGGGKGAHPANRKKQVSSQLFDHKSLVPDGADGIRNQIKAVARSADSKSTVFVGDNLDDLPLEERMISHMKTAMKMVSLTTVQKMTIPTLLSRRDAMIRSPTGTGKTLCYAIPIVHDLQRHSPKVKRSDGPYAVILLPTRELALQSCEVFSTLLRPFVWIVPGVVMGGEQKNKEKSRLRKGVNVLIATPGR